MHTMGSNPQIAIRHSIPGRLRMRISPNPSNVQELIDAVDGHDGIEKISFSPKTGSLLTLFDSRRVTTEEIVLRAATALSLQHNLSSVLILTISDRKSITPASLYAATALGVAFLSGPFGLKNTMKTGIELVAGLSTAGAVIEHGWSEYIEKGYFDPELISILYLINAFMKGNILPAALFTWITSFGRHLFDPIQQGVTVRPIPSEDDSGKSSYRIVLSQEKNSRDPRRLLTLIPSFMKYAFGGGQGAGLLESFRTVSSLHDEIIHGLGTSRDGIPITFS